MEHIYWNPQSKEAKFYRYLLDYDRSLEKDLADCKAIWYESWTNNLMVWDYWMSDRIEAVVISKKFWFIKSLVENDKIDINKIHKIWYIWGHDGYIWYDICCEEPRPNDYECLIMELSIQDKTIEFLISILLLNFHFFWSQWMWFELEEDMIEQTEVEDEEWNIEKEIAIRC